MPRACSVRSTHRRDRRELLHRSSRGDRGCFAEFVAANIGQTVDAGSLCSPFVVTTRTPAPADLPVTKVTFCEARAYCAWAGKVLCGAIGGGPLANGAEVSDREKNAWLEACSNDGTDPVISGTCRRGQPSDAGPAPARSTCEGAFAGVFDLQGNVWEWIDSAVTEEGGEPGAYFLGGSFSSPSDYRCAVTGFPITTSSPALGFRCCSP